MMDAKSDMVRVKLHLGCGKRNFGPEWIHIDGGNFPHLDGHDVVRLDLDPESIDLVYASHLLEYFDKTEVVDVLREWKRVLRPGGVLRLAVPDMYEMMRLYVLGKFPLERFLGPIYGHWTMGNQHIQHKTAYDFESLEELLAWSGFEDVRLWDWRTTEHAEFDDHSQAFLPHMNKTTGTLISLNVEATKP